MTSQRDIYSATFVKNLFNEMSHTYGVVNLVASFGFTYIWRRHCVRNVPPIENGCIVDMMTGMGELFASIERNFDSVESVLAIDFSHEMCTQAARQAARWPELKFEIKESDVLESDIGSETADHIFCSFGLKTLSRGQEAILAREIARILKPGGYFSFIEISVPRNLVLRLPFLFYLRFVIPFIGRLFLGNPSNYRMLAQYTEAFGDASRFQSLLKQEGLSASFYSHFFGCATGVFGSKPA